jgi:gluconokinase
MRSAGIGIEEVRATGGGAGVPLWRSLQADILGVPVLRIAGAQGAAYGAALIARVAAEQAVDLASAASGVRVAGEVDRPDPALAARYDELAGIFDPLYAATADASYALAGWAGTAP